MTTTHLITTGNQSLSGDFTLIGSLSTENYLGSQPTKWDNVYTSYTATSGNYANKNSNNFFTSIQTFPGLSSTGSSTLSNLQVQKIGIGTAPSSYLLDVNGGGNISGDLTVLGASNINNLTIGGTTSFSGGAALAFSTAQFGNVGTLHQSLMSGGAGVSPAFGKPIPDYTWATRPSASTYDGYTIRITDVCVGGSLWISNGTRWYPVEKTINLVVSGAAIASSNTTAEHTLATVTVPAGMMDANTRATMTALFTCTNSGNAKDGRIKFGGTPYSVVGHLNRTISAFAAVVIANNSTSSQKGQNDSTFSITGSLASSTHDTTAAVNFTITAQKAVAGETFTLEHHILTLAFP